MADPAELRSAFKVWLRAEIIRLWEQAQSKGRHSLARFGKSIGTAVDLLVVASDLYLDATEDWQENPEFWNDEEMIDLSMDAWDWVYPE